MPTDNQRNNTSRVYLPTHSKNELNNQSHYQHNYLQSFLINQQQHKEDLSLLISKFHEHSVQLQNHQLSKINDLDDKLTSSDIVARDLHDKLAFLEEQTNLINEQLQFIESSSVEQKELAQEEALRHTALFDQIIHQDRDISFLTEKMNEFNELAGEWKEKLVDSESLYAKVEEKLSIQEVFHKTILENIEETNGNVSKLSRQMEYIKEIIFERVHFLADKVEENLKSIAQPVQRFFFKVDKEDQDKRKQS